MSYHHCTKTRKPYTTRQSLTASGWLKPLGWQISHKEAAVALQMPIERIVKVLAKRHQVIVVYLNDKGQKCSSFFSYRLFARWQTEAIATILSCKDLARLTFLEEIIQYELDHFLYPVEMADAIWENLLDQITRLTVEARFKQGNCLASR